MDCSPHKKMLDKISNLKYFSTLETFRLFNTVKLYKAQVRLVSFRNDLKNKLFNSSSNPV